MSAYPSASSVLHLLAWLSPAFPIGSFAYSHGLETAVSEGWVPDRAGVQSWIGHLLGFGSIRNDMVLVAVTWKAVRAGDIEAIKDANDVALALSAGRERHLETAAMGRAFESAISAAWPGATFDELSLDETALPVAYSIATARQGISLVLAVTGFAYSVAQNLVSAAVRLGPIGQTDGQKVLAALLTEVEKTSAAAESWSIDDLGACTHLSDIAALRHETLYSRLFRS